MAQVWWAAPRWWLVHPSRARSSAVVPGSGPSGVRQSSPKAQVAAGDAVVRTPPPAGDVAPRTPAGSRIRAARKAVRQVAVLVLVVASVSARASPCRAWPSTYRPSAAHLMLRQHRRQKSVTTVAAPASPSRENAFAIRTPLHETARQPHAHVPREVPRDAATKTGRPTPPLPGEPEKLAGQMPFAAGSRIATHSTCEVIGNMSHVAGREETSGQRALYGS